jgi:hypothetical protein
MFTIFSVYKNRPEKEDNTAHQNTLEALHLLNISYKEVQGCYKGMFEQSIKLEGSEGFDLALILADKNNQESILLVDVDNTASLLFLRDEQGDKVLREQVLGKWVKVSKDEAMTHDAWSQFDGEYFVMKGE